MTAIMSAMANSSAPDLEQEAPRADGGQYQCGTCSRSYTRVDHLTRHVRSHTQERPYKCSVCDKHFARADLLRRHAALHIPNGGYPENKRRRVSTKGTASPVRVSRACDGCAENHLKCEDQKPCRRCIARNIACIVAPRLPVDGGRTVEGHLTGIEQGDESSSQQDAPMVEFENRDKPQQPSLPPYEGAKIVDDNFPGQPTDVLGDRYQPENIQQDEPLPDFDTASMPSEVMDFPQMVLFQSHVPTSFPAGTMTPGGLASFGVEMDLDFSALDLSFLDTYNTRVPFEFEQHVRTPRDEVMESRDAPQVRDQHETNQATSQNPLQRSLWRFVPAPRDHAYADQAHLSLPYHDGVGASPESFVDIGKRTTSEKLDAQSRDKILAIVLSQLKSNTIPAITAFPSVELLDNLIQYYLAGPFPYARSWIHCATLRPRTTREELLLALAAAGAVLTPDRALRKLGFAIQEIIRNHIPTVFEADNSQVRGLELQQAFILQLQIGLWSGSSRKIEISESFLQPLLTMIRRGGRFRRSCYPPVIVFEADEGPPLEKKWRTWIEQESFKRLVYQILAHDAQKSISLLVNPLLSYSELGLPLPGSPELWTATSAQEWKALYRARNGDKSVRLPSFSECVANVNLIKESRGLVDTDLTCSAFLYAIWGMVWEHRKQSLLLRYESQIWESGLATMTRHQELVKVLEHYRLNHDDHNVLLLELILMHLNMSPEDIQLFAGFEGAEEARRAGPWVRQWAMSKTARQAVWHAGQLIRASRALSSFHLRDFNAIAVFHAGLAFWAYGVAHGSSNNNHSAQAGASQHQAVWLDNEEASATYRFISLGVGSPALHQSHTSELAVYLSDPKTVLQLVIKTMKHGDAEPLRPNSPLVENLTTVMERLCGYDPDDG